MTHGTAVSVFVIFLVAVVAPGCAELVRRFRIPSVLFELVLGIIIGPQVLGWAHVDTFVDGLRTLGLCFLFFTAGYEIELARLGGPALRRAGVGWLVTLVLALGVGGVLMVTGYVISGLLVGLCMTTTAIGTLLPMLRDRGLLGDPFGRILVAAGTVGEFAPVLAVTVLLGASSPGVESVLLVAFVGIAAAVAVVASRPQPPAVVALVQRHLGTTTQTPVRIVLLLVSSLVVVATALNQEDLIGAFAAGLIVQLAFTDDQAAAMKPRLEAIGFGFLIPIFFVVSGMNFDVRALVSDPSVLARSAVFLLLLLAVRGLPALAVYVGVLDLRRRLSLAFLQAAALPLIVVITGIGVAAHKMRLVNATALVAAGMVSVLVFPLVGFALAGRSGSSDDGWSAVAAGEPADDPTRDLL